MTEPTPTPPDRTRPADSKGRERVLRFQSLAEGAIFASRYEIVGPIGYGGSGEVFEAFDRVAQQRVALKVLFPGASARDVERLRRELRVVRALQHPGIVRLYDIGEAEGLFYVVSELLEGESLAHRLRARRRLPADEAERILRDVLDALGQAHRRGIVHRDIKPANIFLATGGDARERVVLLDFGLAREPGEPGLTATGKFVGTPEYTAPEQARGDRHARPATDLYAIGITLWEMLAGTPPFLGASDLDVLNAQLSRPLPVMPPGVADAPSRVRALLVRLLDKNPDRRPADARAALAELGRGKAGRLRTLLGARLATELAHRRWARIGATVASTSIALLAVGAWLSTPVAVETDGDRIAWVARAGFRVRSEPFDAPVSGAVLLAGKQRLAPSALVLLHWPEPLPRAVPLPREMPSRLLRVDWLGGGRRPFWNADAQHEILGRGAYPYQSEFYLPKRLLRVPAAENGGDEVTVIEVSHAGEYPSRVIVQPTGEGPAVGGYEHPGQTDHVAILPAAEGHPALAVFVAWNNLLGPRPVAFAVPLQGDVHGQAPPYTAGGRLADTSRYYLPLPYDRKIHSEIRLDDGVARIRVARGREYRFDAARGIPLDAADRGGLDPDAWDARRRAVFDALFRAQAEAQMGHPRGAAAIVGAAVAAGTGGPALDALAGYWTAIFHLKAGAPAAALVAIDRALALEPDAARMLLLRAETQVRLGALAAARETLRDFWATSSPEMYRYEWMLLCKLAGDDVPLAAALGEFASQPRHTWGAQIRLAHAVLFGDPRDARGATDDDAFHRDEFDYWEARAWLEGADPDPAKALAAIARGRKAYRSGIVIPWAALEARARRLADPSWRASPAELAAIARERRELANWSYRGTEALVMGGENQRRGK